MENPLASTNPERAASRHRTCLGLLAVGIASDIRARRSTGHKVVALGVLDLSHVLPLDRVLALARDQVREVVCWRSVTPPKCTEEGGDAQWA